MWRGPRSWTRWDRAADPAGQHAVRHLLHRLRPHPDGHRADAGADVPRGSGREPRPDPGVLHRRDRHAVLRAGRRVPRRPSRPASRPVKGVDVSTPLVDAWRTMVPPAGDPHGPLPPLLLALTIVTGLVDAFSYLVLGHVFVANMTGNVVFLGFALAGATGFSIPASLAALGAFSLGALIGGRLIARLGTHRGRRLAVPDLTTTVLTLTITGIFADGRLAGGAASKVGRRLLSTLAMFLGGLGGALLVLRDSAPLGIAVALIILCLVAASAAAQSRTDRPWSSAAKAS